MKDNYWSVVSWSNRYDLSDWKWELTREKLWEKLEECGFEVKPTLYNFYTFFNPNLKISICPEEKVFGLGSIDSIYISNSKTMGRLSCNGYKTFGNYISDRFYNDFLNKNWSNVFKLSEEDIAKWTDFFFDELKTYVKDISSKIEKKNKKNKIKDKIQEIETDIDFAILDYAESHKQYGITLDKKSITDSNTISIEYFLQKHVSGLGKIYGVSLLLRKMKNGTWEFYYKDNSMHNPIFSNIRVFNKDIKSEVVTKLIEEYFEPWYNVPTDLTPRWSFSLDSVSTRKTK